MIQSRFCINIDDILDLIAITQKLETTFLKSIQTCVVWWQLDIRKPT